MNKKAVLYAALGALLALLSWRFTGEMYFGRMESLDRRIASAARTLEEIRALSPVADETGAGGFLAGRGRDYTPLSFLEGLSEASGVDYELIYREPRTLRAGDEFLETSVRVELRGIDAPGLTEYLYAVENSGEFLRIRNLNIRPQEGLLRASFDVATLIPR